MGVLWVWTHSKNKVNSQAVYPGIIIIWHSSYTTKFGLYLCQPEPNQNPGTPGKVSYSFSQVANYLDPQESFKNDQSKL